MINVVVEDLFVYVVQLLLSNIVVLWVFIATLC